MRFTPLDGLARWVMRAFFNTSPEEEFVRATLIRIQNEGRVSGSLTVIDNAGRTK